MSKIFGQIRNFSDENHGRHRILKKKNSNFKNSVFLAFFACNFFRSNYRQKENGRKMLQFMCQTRLLGVSGRRRGVPKVTMSDFFDLLTIFH